MSRKKTFDDSPVMQFISDSQNKNVSKKKTQQDYRIKDVEKLVDDCDTGNIQQQKPAAKETRSKRVNLLVKPSVFQELEKIAYMKKISLNELFNNLLDDCITRNKENINKYNKTFP